MDKTGETIGQTANDNAGGDRLSEVAGAFDADKARKNQLGAKQRIAEEARNKEEALKQQREQARLEYQERMQREQAEKEQRQREHAEAWEKRQESFDYPKTISSIFTSKIDSMIKEASDKGEDSVKLVEEAAFSYGPYQYSYEKDSVASILTGFIAGSDQYDDPQRIKSTALDSLLEEPDNAEFKEDILELADQLAGSLAEDYKSKGFHVETVPKEYKNPDGEVIITSISWGEQPEQPAEQEQPIEKAKPAASSSVRSRLSSLFGRKR